MSQQHIYLRSLDQQGGENSLSAIIGQVPKKSVVLDLGCGAGILGQFLAQQKNCIVDGVTLSTDEAAIARPYYRDLLVGDLEQINLTETFSTRQYDCIVCADVLEHLKSPERVLDACLGLLAPQGRLLVSIPNASYSGLLLELMQGEFKYRTEGLLDRTHLRFFTRQSLIRFLQDQGWAIETLTTIERPLDDSEFKGTRPDHFPPAVVRYLLAQPDALTYQFVCAVRPATDQTAEQTTTLLARSAQEYPSFTSDLYLGNAGQFSEESKLTRRGKIGQLHQHLRFDLPACAEPAPVLRWDPADRPGFLHLHSIRLYDSQGQLRWTWRRHTMQEALHHPLSSSHIYLQPASATAPHSTLLLLTSDDPWLHLPIDHQVLHECLSSAGSVLDIQLGWPMSADYAALANRTHAIQADLVRADQEIHRWQHKHDQQVHALHAALQHQHQLQHQVDQVQQANAHLHVHIHNIEASRSYRAVKKLGRIKQRMLGQKPPTIAASAPCPPVQTANPPPVAAVTTSTPPPQASACAPAAAPLTSDTGACSVTEIDSTSPASALIHPAETVDIIIPVYRGLEDTQRCINSVLQSDYTVQHRIIVINDASPEPALTEWLRQLAAQEPRITLLENESNLGFVATVNRGMSLHPEHDVLLLNSDTQVHGNWLDRLRATAYRHATTGTVTPLSNNATICSYPRFCANNELPPGFDVTRLDLLCANTLPEASIDIPTAVGFCMYIRRDCLSHTGLFDTEHFGKGYGEENDFCMRAHGLGWKHQLALDTFVLHTGGVSFGASKTPREEAAYAVLQRLHPEYDALIQAHLQTNPGQTARNQLDKARMRLSALPCVLMVTHSLGGGTLRHVRELAHSLQERANTLTLIPLPDHMLRLQWLAPHAGYTEDFHWPNDAQALRDTLLQLGVQHVHYHHLLGLNPGLMQLAAELGTTYDFTAHDYYSVCPQVTLTLSDQRYCEEQGPAQCARCLTERPAPTQESIEDWRLRHRHFLAHARYVLAPSHDAAERLQRYFPQAPLRVAPHLDIPDRQALPIPQSRRLTSQQHLRVFLLGGVSANKGGEIMQAVAQAAARTQAPLELHLIGYPHRPMPVQPHASLTVHGAYAEADLPLLLERLQPDLVWFPALWPETYSYTLSAALQAALPIVATNIGAFSERLSLRPWTWLEPWHTSPDEWLTLFLSIRQRYFVDGQIPPPAPESHVHTTDADGPVWDYAQYYLPQQT